jgi:hypothetical protein
VTQLAIIGGVFLLAAGAMFLTIRYAKREERAKIAAERAEAKTKAAEELAKPVSREDVADALDQGKF